MFAIENKDVQPSKCSRQNRGRGLDRGLTRGRGRVRGRGRGDAVLVIDPNPKPKPNPKPNPNSNPNPNPKPNSNPKLIDGILTKYCTGRQNVTGGRPSASGDAPVRLTDS